MFEAQPDYSQLAKVVEGLGLHEHLCLIYDTQEEQFAASLPYLRIGLERGEKCLYIVDENTAGAVLSALRKSGADVDQYLRSGALTIASKRETYVVERRFDPDRMISFLAQATTEAEAAKFSGLRTVLGEMTWALGDSIGATALIEYESKLNTFVRDYNARVICQYNRARFPPELILGVIRTHPLVVYGGIVCKNPYYIPPDEYLKQDQASQEVERLLHNIQMWERAEQALRHSDEILRLFIDTIPTMAWTVRPDGGVDFVNQRWRDYTGLSLDKEIENPTQPIHPEDLSRVMEKWRADMAAGESFENEMRLRRADGEYRWFLVRTMPLRDERKNIVKWYGASIDIEDRKRAEDELRRQKEILQKIFDNVPAMIGFIGTDGRIKLANREWERTLRWTLDEVLGRDVDAFAELYPDPLYRQEVLSFFFNSNAKWADFRTRTRDGRVIDTSWGSVHLSDGTTIAIGREITERKRAEEELRRSEAYLAAGQRLSHTGSWALNVPSGELFWSQETFRIFGFDPSTTKASVAGTFLQRIHPEDRPRIEQGLKEAIESRDYAADYRIVLEDGSIRHVHDVVYSVADQDGRIVERYGVVMDMTERKRSEEELQRSHDQLRALAGRLQSVREEERTRVAREIHDELGQAMTAIKIDLSRLSRDLPGDKKQRFESILRLVDETIQSVRRISSELRPPILDAVGLVAAIEWAAGEFAARTGTQCHFDLPQDDIVIDEECATALFRILQETLTNIARHASATVVNVRLEVDGNLILEVRDNGKGFNEEQLSVGSSLGILGMQERAVLLGGEVTIAGATGAGTTVRVRIPKKRSRRLTDLE